MTNGIGVNGINVSNQPVVNPVNNIGVTPVTTGYSQGSNNNPVFTSQNISSNANGSIPMLKGYVSENRQQTQQPVQMKNAQSYQQPVQFIPPEQNIQFEQSGIHPVDFIKSLGKGVAQGFGDIGQGLGRRYGNDIRQVFGKKPLTPYETDNLYGKVMGLPEDGGAYNTGKIIGELILFIILPEVTVARFPLISNLLLTVLYQSIIDSTTHSIIDHGVSKNLIPDVINGIAMGLINALATHGLLRGLDSSVLFRNLQQKLQKLMNELAESFGKPIVQNNGTMVLKKYNGDTATPEEVAERILSNLRKHKKKLRKERELIKKELKNNPKGFIIYGKKYKQIWLPEKEHGAVRSAFTTYIMQAGYNDPILIRCYGDYIYTAVLENIDGQLMPVFVEKILIKGVKR